MDTRFAPTRRPRTRRTPTALIARQLGAALIALTVALQALSAEQPAALQLTVETEFIELHSGPGRGFPVIYVCEHGEAIELLKRRTQWYQVRTRRDKIGWVSLAQLQRATDAKQNAFFTPTAPARPTLDKTWRAGAATGDFAGANLINIYLGYQFTDNIGSELSIGQATGGVSNSLLAQLAVLHHPFPSWRVSPFFALGLGAVHTQPSATLVQTEDRNDQFLRVGIGGQYWLSGGLILRFEYNNLQVLTSRNENEDIDEWKLGFSVAF